MSSTLPSGESSEIRQRILNAAIPLFARRGYGSASVRELSGAAGVTKPTLYYHFGNKEGLFVAAVESAVDRFHQAVIDAIKMPGTLRERLHYAIHAQTRTARSNPDAFRLLLNAEYHSGAGQPRVDLMSIHVRNAQFLEALLREGIASGELKPDLDPGCAVIAFVGMIGTTCQAMLYGFEMPENLPARLTDIFFDGVGNP